MTVAYEGYWALCIRQAIAAIAASATFQQLIDTATPGDRIVEIDGGHAQDGANIRASTGSVFSRDIPLWCHVCPEPFDVQNIWLGAPPSTANEGTIPAAFYFKTGLAVNHEALRYCLSKTGLIARDIVQQAATAGMWRRIQCQLAGIQLMDPAGPHRAVCRTAINISFGDLA